MGFFEELGRHTTNGGSLKCSYCRACNKVSVEHVFFSECASYDSPKQNSGPAEASSYSKCIMVAFLIKLYFAYDRVYM